MQQRNKMSLRISCRSLTHTPGFGQWCSLADCDVTQWHAVFNCARQSLHWGYWLQPLDCHNCFHNCFRSDHNLTGKTSDPLFVWHSQKPHFADFCSNSHLARQVSKSTSGSPTHIFLFMEPSRLGMQLKLSQSLCIFGAVQNYTAAHSYGC